MRLSRLQLKNFRTFLDLEVELDDLTVLVGPNDAGKSTLLDAVRCLLSTVDRFGHPWRRQSAEPRPRQFSFIDHPSFWEDDYSPWQEEHVTVVGTFSDLSPVELDVWGSAAAGGELRIGVFFDPLGSKPDDAKRGPFLLWPKGQPHPRIPPPHVGQPRTVDDAPADDSTDWLDVQIGQRIMTVDGKQPGVVVPLQLPVPVSIAGPESAPVPLDRLIEPIVMAGVDRIVERIPEAVRELIEKSLSELEGSLSTSLSRSVPHYLDDAIGARLQTGPWPMHGDILRHALRAPLEKIGVSLRRRYGAGDRRDWDQEAAEATEQQEVWRDSEPEHSLGAGARRALTLAALELYADPDMWPAERSVAILIEEPEVGLHPAAQRRVATALLRLSGVAGVSALIVTHSPVLINAAELDGVRLIRPAHESGRVVRPDTLGEIAELLGAEPADVLLGECFVVVEGPSDGRIFTTWARKLGIHFDRLGIRFVDAKGWTKADVVAELLRLTYPSARFHIILDGGEEISGEVERLQAKHGPRVQIDQLHFREIEAYLSEHALQAWVASSGGGEIDTDRLQESRDNGEVSRWLHGVAHRVLGRSRGYDKIYDGPAIAALMTEPEIAPEIKDLLMRLAEA